MSPMLQMDCGEVFLKQSCVVFPPFPSGKITFKDSSQCMIAVRVTIRTAEGVIMLLVTIKYRDTSV